MTQLRACKGEEIKKQASIGDQLPILLYLAKLHGWGHELCTLTPLKGEEGGLSISKDAGDGIIDEGKHA